MDSLTHLVAGALTPLAFRGTPKRAAVIGFGIAAGELPDFDIILGRGPEALLTIHRGVTHALFWQPFFALLAVIPFYIWLHTRCARQYPGPDGAGYAPARAPARAPAGSGLGNFEFSRMWLIAVIACCIHVYLDCMTTFGTQALLPFSHARISVPAMFIVDLLLTVPLLALLVLALRRPPDILPGEGAGKGFGFAFYSSGSVRLARLGLAWVLLYPLAALGVNQAATALYAPVLLNERPALEDPEDPNAAPAYAAERLILMTEPFSPVVWKAIVDEGKSWRMTTLILPAPGRERRYLAFAKPEPELYETLKRQHRVFAEFENFAPLMTQTVRPAAFWVQKEHAAPVSEYSFADLRYLAAPESVTRLAGRGDPLFVLEARVDEAGTLLAWRMLKRANDRDSTPWEAVK